MATLPSSKSKQSKTANTTCTKAANSTCLTKASNKKDKGTNILEHNNRDWSPLMDGIVPITPLMKSHLNNADDPTKCLQRMMDVVDEEIDEVLYGPEKPRRLSVFKELCREK
nr:hypothetical protein TEA_004688 [Ipomoea batatas]GMD58399.1 hypothetical protein TEA_004688 [Ipomoea batatas]